LDKKGIQLVSIAESFDMSSPYGGLWHRWLPCSPNWNVP
jgi:hypothetical protein